MYPIVERIDASGLVKGVSSIFGAVLVNSQADAISSYLKSAEAGIDDIYVECSENDDAVSLLNAGVTAVIVSPQAAEHLIEQGIPIERIIVVANANTEEIVANGHGIYLKSPASDETLHTLVKLATDFSTKHHSATAPIFVESAQAPKTAINDISYILPSGNETIIETLKKLVKSDRPDGLWSTVVTNRAHQALGLCYSSAESLCEAYRTRTGVYQSRKRGLWYKGQSSGATQKLLRIRFDCDNDALEFVVDQKGPGFCHNNITSCFGSVGGLTKLTHTVQDRLADAPEGSYTARLTKEKGLLEAKIREEADELCEAETASEVAFEAADLLYFISVKLAKHGLTFADVEANLDKKSKKVTRRPGNAKPGYLSTPAAAPEPAKKPTPTPAAAPAPAPATADIHMKVLSSSSPEVRKALQRPAHSSNAFDLARPIIEKVKESGDAALIELTAKFEHAQLKSPTLQSPYSAELMKLPQELKDAIDLACENVSKFHAAQLTDPLKVETSPGVVCSRFSRPIDKVGLYVPGGTAILPSTAIMLGIPAKVAGCNHISIATPPRADGTPSPEVVYVAHKIGASQIVLAGGAQAVAALAYGTESVQKVDKILGPGNQFVTAAKMIVSTDLAARVSIDMPAGPSEVLVVADKFANKTYVAADLLSQAEHGPDSQVILVAIDWSGKDIEELQTVLDKQAKALPRVEVIRKSIGHSTIILTKTAEEALEISNLYAPEHLILQVENAASLVPQVNNAGSVFVGAYSPESCGDYTSGTNHTLPTYGYAQQYSGVNTGTYLKYITAQELTAEGIKAIGPATIALARREGLDAHAHAVVVRLK